MGADGVSQAAALALRQLQDQLAAAYTDLAACQVPYLRFSPISGDKHAYSQGWDRLLDEQAARLCLPAWLIGGERFFENRCEGYD